MAKKIIPLFPSHTCYCEPFCGAAAIFFLKEESKAEVVNDINSDLVNLYRVLQNHLDEFVRQFRWILVSREIFKILQITNNDTLTDIQRAARFYYLQKLAFGGMVTSQTFGTTTTTKPKLNLLRIEEELSNAHLRIARAQIEHLSWQDCITKYDRPHTLFYLDPPYWQVRGYGVDFPLDEYKKMARIMQSMTGKAILSINNHPDMIKIFRGFKTESVTISYTCGRLRGRKTSELVVKSW